MKMICWVLALLSWFNVSSQAIFLTKKASGVYTIDCKVNSVPMVFIFDTGCNDVTISKLEAKFLIKQHLLDTADIHERHVYMSANGQLDTCINFVIRKLEIGSLVLENIEASIVDNVNSPLLLGQTALEKMGPMIVDFERQIIKIKTDD